MKPYDDLRAAYAQMVFTHDYAVRMWRKTVEDPALWVLGEPLWDCSEKEMNGIAFIAWSIRTGKMGGPNDGGKGIGNISVA